jgi:hypothetical protein
MHAPIVRIIADSTGGSRFADGLDLLAPTDVASPATSLGASAPSPATATRFIVAPAGWDSPPHPAPSLRWVIILSGTVEVRTTDGDVRRFGPGAAIHLEDTTGTGHATRVLAGEDWVAFVVVESNP